MITVIKDKFLNFKQKFSDTSFRKSFFKSCLTFLPALILFISFIVLVSIDDHDPRTVIVMFTFVVLLFAVPTVKLLKIVWLEKLLKIGSIKIT